MARNKKNKKNIDLIFILLLILSVVLGITIYLQTGYIGQVISPVFGGFFGMVKNIIPVGIFLLALATAREEKKSYTTRIIQFVIIIIALCSLLTILEISKENFKTNAHFMDILTDSYDAGKVNIGGGFAGTIVAVPFVKLFGLTGAAIILSVITFILTFTAFSGSPTLYIREKIDERKEIKEEREKDREKERAIRLKEREKERKERQKQKEKEILEGQLRLNLEKESEIEEESFLKKLFNKKEDMVVDNDSHHNDENVDDLEIEKDISANDESKEQLLSIDTSEGALEEFAVSEEDEKYIPPPLSLLKYGKPVSKADATKMITGTASNIQKTLYSFGVSAKVDNVSIGPAVTRYELVPAEGVRVNKIANLSDDIALNLAAESLRIEAPIPGKRAVGIEVPNELREMVALRDVIESKEFKDENSKVSFALGKSTSGEYVIADIAKMPHVLIAGSTGSGKSVCINSLITSIIYNAKPSETKLILIDPKVVELSIYNELPHLATPEVVTDPKMALGTLQRVVHEMTRRFKVFAEANAKNIETFNSKNKEQIPYLVVIIDELADLMMTAAKEVEAAICRIAQMGRAAGIHLVVATQRPSVDVITGLIKANMPTRIAFAVTSQVDSRTILDQGGAEKLLGKGDMLYYPLGATRPIRIQGAFISEKETNSIIRNIRRKKVPESAQSFWDNIKEDMHKEEVGDTRSSTVEKRTNIESDELLDDIMEMFFQRGNASLSLIRRRFSMGDSRAGRIMDHLEDMGAISAPEGRKPRNLLITREEWEEMQESEDIEEIEE